MPRPARINTDSSVHADARHQMAMVRVWDRFVRLFHWGLALSFVVAWFTPQSTGLVHQWAGYVAAALILGRLAWGFLGTPHARFAHFVRGPGTVARYLRAMLEGREARHIGHNPAGGAMILALMATMTLTAFTGWLTTTDRYFGVAWMQDAHEMIANGMLILVLLHVGGVLFASLRHRENLVGAMVTGRKRRAAIEDVA